MLKILDGSDLLADQYGPAPLRVLALHGWSRDRSDWSGVLSATGGAAVDLPAFGTEPIPSGVWGTSDYALHILGAVTAMARPVLIGHSFGGRVAVRFAAAHPDLVSGIVLTGTPVGSRPASKGRPPLLYRLARHVSRLGVGGELLMDRMRRRYGSADYNELSGLMRDIFVRVVNETYDDDVTRISRCEVPVTLVWGSEDIEVPVRVAEELHRRIRGSALSIVEGSGHLLDRNLQIRIGRAAQDMLASQSSTEAARGAKECRNLGAL